MHLDEFAMGWDMKLLLIYNVLACFEIQCNTLKAYMNYKVIYELRLKSSYSLELTKTSEKKTAFVLRV